MTHQQKDEEAVESLFSFEWRSYAANPSLLRENKKTEKEKEGISISS